jgi:hypothetical protein
MKHVVRSAFDFAKIPERYGEYRTVCRPLEGLSADSKKMAEAVRSMLEAVGYPCVVIEEAGCQI